MEAAADRLGTKPSKAAAMSPTFAKGLKVEVCDKIGSGRYTPGSIRKVNRDGTFNVVMDETGSCRFNVPLHLVRSPLNGRSLGGSAMPPPPNSVVRDPFYRQLEISGMRSGSPADSDASNSTTPGLTRWRTSNAFTPGSNNKVPLSMSSSSSTTTGATTPSPTAGATALSEAEVDRIQRLGSVALGSNTVGLILRRLNLYEKHELSPSDFLTFFRKGLKVMSTQVNTVQLEALFLILDVNDSKLVPCNKIADFLRPWYQQERQKKEAAADHQELGALRMRLFNAAFSLGGNRWADLLLRHDKRGLGRVAARDFHSLVRRTLKLKATEISDRQIATIFRALAAGAEADGEYEVTDSLGRGIFISDLEDFIRSPYSKFRPFVSPSANKVELSEVAPPLLSTTMAMVMTAAAAPLTAERRQKINEMPHWVRAKTRRAIPKEEMDAIRYKCFGEATSFGGRDYAAFFQHLDKNHDGVLQPDEFHSMFRRVLRLSPGAVSDGDIAAVFHSLDGGRTGAVHLADLVEFANLASSPDNQRHLRKEKPNPKSKSKAAVQQQPQQPQQQQQQRVAIFEHINEQPYWHAARFRAIPKAAMEAIRLKCFGLAHVNGGRDFSVLFQHLDKDHDGVLEPDEFYSLFRRVLQSTPEAVPDEHIAAIFHKLDHDGAGAVSLGSLVDFANTGVDWKGYDDEATAKEAAADPPPPAASKMASNTPETASSNDSDNCGDMTRHVAPVQVLDSRFHEVAASENTSSNALQVKTPHIVVSGSPTLSAGDSSGVRGGDSRTSSWRERLKQKSPTEGSEAGGVVAPFNAGGESLEEIADGIHEISSQLQQQLNVTARRTRSLQKHFGSSLGNVLKRADIPSDVGVWAERVEDISVDKADEYIGRENELYQGLLANLASIEGKVALWKSQGDETSEAFLKLLSDLETVEGELHAAVEKLQETCKVASTATSLEEELKLTRRALEDAEVARAAAEKEAAAQTMQAEKELRKVETGTGVLLIGAAVGAGLLLRSNPRVSRTISQLSQLLYSKHGS